MSAVTAMPTRREARLRHARRFLAQLREIEKCFQRGGDYARLAAGRFSEAWPQIQAGQSRAEQYAAAAAADDIPVADGGWEAAARLCSGYAATATSPASGESLIDMRRHPRERVRWLSAGLAAAQRLHDERAEVVHSYDLGLVYIELHEYAAGVACLDRSLRIFRAIGDREQEGVVLNALGSAHEFIGEPRRALQHYEQALAIFRAAGRHSDVAFTLGSVARVCDRLGEAKRAGECRESILSIARELGDVAGEASALKGLALYHLNLGDRARAEALLDDAARVFRGLGPQAYRSFYTTDLIHIAMTYASLGRPQGIEDLERDLVAFRDVGHRLGEGYTLLCMGLSHWALRQDVGRSIPLYAEALTVLREAGNQVGEGLALHHSGISYASAGDGPRALASYEAAAAVFRGIGYRQGEANAMWHMSLALDRMGRRAEAVRLAQTALGVYEQIEHPRRDEVRRQLAEWHRTGPSGSHGSAEVQGGGSQEPGCVA